MVLVVLMCTSDIMVHMTSIFYMKRIPMMTHIFVRPWHPQVLIWLRTLIFILIAALEKDISDWSHNM